MQPSTQMFFKCTQIPLLHNIQAEDSSCVDWSQYLYLFLCLYLLRCFLNAPAHLSRGSLVWTGGSTQGQAGVYFPVRTLLYYPSDCSFLY